LTDIASFQISDGSRIYGELLQASDGNFYGAACAGGGGSSNGTVFRVNREGVFKVLHNFDGNDGSCPEAALVEGTDGNFYGTTSGDGTDIHGTVFQITPAGALTTLHAFNLTDGGNIGGLMQATDGNFYGVAFEGGYYGYGTLFQISMGLGPFIRTVPYFGRTGTSITILGNNLAGTSSVTFNGVAAAFTVISATAIRATVPAGATNGKVQVVTPHGTLVSNTLFEVLPRSAAP